MENQSFISDNYMESDKDNQTVILDEIRSKVADDVYDRIHQALEFSKKNSPPQPETRRIIISYEGVSHAGKA